MPLFGQVVGSITGLPVVASAEISPLASRLNLTMLPWHCQQPLTASAMLPGMPAAFSASTLSRLARISPARAWWLRENSLYSRSWHCAQSFGVTRTDTQAGPCCQASTSPSFAPWQSTQPTPFRRAGSVPTPSRARATACDGRSRTDRWIPPCSRRPTRARRGVRRGKIPSQARASSSCSWPLPFLLLHHLSWK